MSIAYRLHGQDSIVRYNTKVWDLEELIYGVPKLCECTTYKIWNHVILMSGLKPYVQLAHFPNINESHLNITLMMPIE